MPLNIRKLLVIVAVILMPLSAGAQEITGPDVRTNDGRIVVSTALKLDEKQLDDISKGISKEIDIYVDLFRVWNSWPDEFVLGDRFTRTLSCNPVKKEYVATSLHGDILREKRFSDCDSLINWALKVEDLKLANVSGLEPSDYFVKVRAESRLRKLPPVVGYLFFFVKEKEYKISRESEIFTIAEEVKEEPAK